MKLHTCHLIIYSTCTDQDVDICTEIACVKPGGQGEFMHMAII